MKSSKIKNLVYFIKIKLLLRNKKNFFFFPFYHIGGAERVHSDILELFDSKDSICIITDTSENDHFYNDFKSNLKLIEIEKLPIHKKEKTYKHIIKHINKTNGTIFGCNSKYFYDLIQDLKKEVRVLDLIHAFSYEVKTASEKYSLPIATRFNKRVILGSKTYLDFKQLYQENNISSKYLENLVIIKNKVPIPEKFPSKPVSETLKIIFVGRNSPEKRVNLFFAIAEFCLIKKINVNFFVIGNFDIVTQSKPYNTTIIGEISDANLLKEIYISSDIILTTSSREGLPMVILEGMANGVLPICTDVGEISELIKPELENGFLITNYENDHEIIKAFCDTIDFLDQNRYLLKKYQENGYNSIKENYSPEKFKAAYLKLFS